MDRLKAFGMKFIVIGVITFSIFGIFNETASMGRLLVMSLLITGITFIGDLFVLPKIGNWKASVADFGLFFVLYWSLATFFIGGPVPMVLTSLAAAFFSAISDAIIHIYMLEKIFGRTYKKQITFSNELQTEFAEETDAHSINKTNNTNHPNKK